MNTLPHPPGDSDHSNQEAFSKDSSAIQAALRYVNAESSKWILDPAEVVVEQPLNQKERLDELKRELGSKIDGDTMQHYLEANLSLMKSKQAQPESMGFGRLLVKRGFTMPTGLTREEYEILRSDSWSYCDVVIDKDQKNTMINGLLLATGAKLLRSDTHLDSTVRTTSLYKGMFNGAPVYFLQTTSPRAGVESEAEDTPLERYFSVMTEASARYRLEQLSEQDTRVLGSVGITPPLINTSEYNLATYPNRSRMAEVLALLAIANPPQEENLNHQDNQ